MRRGSSGNWRGRGGGGLSGRPPTPPPPPPAPPRRAPAAERRRVVLITPGATAPLPYGGHYVFRTALPARTQAQALAAYLVEQLRVRRVAVVHDSNDYGTMVALAFEGAARAKGATITGRRLFRDGEQDF